MKLVLIKLILFIFLFTIPVNGVILKIINHCGPDLKVSVFTINDLLLNKSDPEELDIKEKHFIDEGDDDDFQNNTFRFGQDEDLCRVILEFKGVKCSLWSLSLGCGGECCDNQHECILIIDWDELNNKFECSLHGFPKKESHHLEPGMSKIHEYSFSMMKI